MKIRNGFVSNSSSSSFVIALPREFKITDEVVTKVTEQLNKYDKDWTEEKVRRQIPEVINALCSGNGYFDSRDDYSSLDFSLAKALVFACNFVIGDVDMGCSEYQIHNCLSDNSKEFVLNLFKTLLEICNED